MDVAGDSSAYLGIDPGNKNGGGPNAAFAEYDSDSQLEINLDGSASGGFSGTQGDGVNPNAVTDIDEVFTIRNNGTQAVGIYISNSVIEVTFYAQNSVPDGGHRGGKNKAPSGTSDSGTPTSDSIEGSSNYVEVRPGEYLEVSIEVDTTSVSGTQDLLDSITVNAEAGLI